MMCRFCPDGGMPGFYLTAGERTSLRWRVRTERENSSPAQCGLSVKKAVGPISRVLSPAQGGYLSFIRAYSRLHALSFYPPAQQNYVCFGRVTLCRRYTRTFSLRGARPPRHRDAGGLLPHLLTLTRTIRAVFFFCTAQPLPAASR